MDILGHRYHADEEVPRVTKVVVLDVDGTLMDTNYLHTEAWGRALEQVGVRVPWAEPTAPGS